MDFSQEEEGEEEDESQDEVEEEVDLSQNNDEPHVAEIEVKKLNAILTYSFIMDNKLQYWSIPHSIRIIYALCV